MTERINGKRGTIKMQRSILSNWRPFWKRDRAVNKKPKSKLRRVADALAGTLLLAYLLLLWFPQVVFAHSASYRNIRVCSTAPLNSNVYPILHDAARKLAGSEADDPRASYRVFLCPSHAAFAFFSPLTRAAFANNLPFVHTIFVNAADVATDQVTTGAEKHGRRTLSGVIAHECTHTLLARRFGQTRMLLTPSWKQEGYCDYVAQATSFDRAEGVRLLTQGGSDSSRSFYYFKAFTAIAYLKDHRHWSLARIMDTPLNLDDIVREATSPRGEKPAR